jgi:sulfur carrier protein
MILREEPVSAQIHVNGQPEPLATATLDALLRLKGIAEGARGVAVALNGEVVPVRRWAATTLRPGDDLEIVRPFSGG